MDEADVVSVNGELLWEDEGTVRVDVVWERPVEELGELPLGKPVVMVEVCVAVVDSSVASDDELVDGEADTTGKGRRVTVDEGSSGCPVAGVVALPVSEVDALGDPKDATGTTVMVSGTTTVVLGIAEALSVSALGITVVKVTVLVEVVGVVVVSECEIFKITEARDGSASTLEAFGHNIFPRNVKYGRTVRAKDLLWHSDYLVVGS